MLSGPPRRLPLLFPRNLTPSFPLPASLAYDAFYGSCPRRTALPSMGDLVDLEHCRHADCGSGSMAHCSLLCKYSRPHHSRSIDRKVLRLLAHEAGNEGEAISNRSRSSQEAW